MEIGYRGRKNDVSRRSVASSTPGLVRVRR
ncbi:Uncharacterised protein [Mycobacteroides abscessus]|nr:Uncharacterised protein [Mycobacteroides abscessus]